MFFLKWLQILKCTKKQNSLVADNNDDINADYSDENNNDDKNNDLNIHCSIIGGSYVADDDMFDSYDILQSRKNLLGGIKRIRLKSKTVTLRLDGLDKTLVKRLGFILRQSNTTLSYLSLTGNPKNHASVIWLCLGLELNRSIETLFISKLRLRGPTKMHMLGPFLIHNSSLQKLTLNQCKLTHEDINCLGDHLLHRSSNTLEELDLGGNFIGDYNLDELVAVLIKMNGVKRLNLSHNYIAGKAVMSLKRLLESNSSIEELDISANHGRWTSIDAEVAVCLIQSLQHNNTLKHLNFGRKVVRPDLADEEWWGIVLPCVLQLICDTTSIDNTLNSNHTLSSIGPNRFQDPEEMRSFFDIESNSEDTINSLDALYNRCLGEDLAQLLHSSFCTNYDWFGKRRNVAKVQRKIIRCHTRGDFNIGEASIDVAALPQVLSLFWDDLDAFFRIVNIRPDLCAQSSSISSLLRVCQKDTAYYQYEIGKLRLENERLKDLLNL